MPTRWRPSSRRRHWTEEGRIVYDRALHKFHPSDVVRIQKKLDLNVQDTEKLVGYAIEELDHILRILSALQYRVLGNVTAMLPIFQGVVNILFKIRAIAMDLGKDVVAFFWQSVKDIFS